MGSALLLGPGLAAAVDIQLDGTRTAAPSPVMYATETLMANDEGMYGITAPANELDLHVKPRRRIEAGEDVFIRVQLNGAMFGATAPTYITATRADDGTVTIDTSESTATEVSSGGTTSSFVVFPVGEVELTETVGIRVVNLLASSNTGSISAAISSYTNPDDALDGVGATSAFSGSSAIIRMVSGVTTIIKPAPAPAVASVDTGFLRFAVGTVGPAATGYTNTGGGQAILGWLGVEENIVDPGNNPNMLPITYHGDGGALENDDIIMTDGMISFNVMGNLDIGAFSVNAEDATFDRDTLANTAGCMGVGEGSVDPGELFDADGETLIDAEDGALPSGATEASTGPLAEGLYVLCVNVDVMGPGTNMTPIPEGTYTATAHIDGDGNALTPTQMVGEEMTVGVIDRDGASVEIPYLTTSEKHNQRIIVVNRGTSPVPITSIVFTSEDGTEVELMDTAQTALDAGLLAVPGQSSWVARMDQTVSITGDSRRTAATISFFGVADNLSVATTQVNVSDGSTDTVVYEVTD